MSNLRDAIKKMSENVGSNVAVVGKVLSVDTSARTCDVEPVSGDSDILDVRLQANPDDGLLMIPAVGSYVVVGWINEYTGYVAMYSQLDSIQFLDGSLGGLIKIQDLVTKLNTIEQDINTLKQAFTNWVVVASDGGAALKAITATWAGSTLTETQVNDIENDKITHGN